jgi:hypothetical protein
MNCPTLFLAAAFVAPAFGQPHCTVQEERHWRTLTAHFSIGSVTANVTLPTIVFRSNPPTVFLEVSGDGTSGFRMETGGVNVPLRNGAALRPAPKVGERILFTLTSGNGQPLCTWQPLFPRGWRSGKAPQRTDAFSRVDAGFLRKLGDPIALWVAAGDAREFAIEGLPAMVLARGASEVILRDPRPRAGRRSVASKGLRDRTPFHRGGNTVFDAVFQSPFRTSVVLAPCWQCPRSSSSVSTDVLTLPADSNYERRSTEKGHRVPRQAGQDRELSGTTLRQGALPDSSGVLRRGARPCDCARPDVGRRRAGGKIAAAGG